MLYIYIMDYYRVLCRYYPEGYFYLSDTKDYSTLKWLYVNTPKPTKEEVEQLYELCSHDFMKEDIEYEEMIKKMNSTSIVQEQQKQIETLQEQLADVLTRLTAFEKSEP